MKQPKVVFFRDAKKKWRWSLVAANGRKLCTPGESFSSKSKAVHNFDRVAAIFFDAYETNNLHMEYNP